MGGQTANEKRDTTTMMWLDRFSFFDFTYRCAVCGHGNHENHIPNFCPHCGRLVENSADYRDLCVDNRERPKEDAETRDAVELWRKLRVSKVDVWRLKSDMKTIKDGTTVGAYGFVVDCVIPAFVDTDDSDCESETVL